MNPIETKLHTAYISLLNHWLSAETVTWPFLGLVAGACLAIAWTQRRTILGGYFLAAGILIGSAEFGLYLLLPAMSADLVGQAFTLPYSHLWINIAGLLAGVMLVVLLVRYFSSAFEMVTQQLTRPSKLERNRKTDIRYIATHLPNPQRMYDPTKYFNSKKGVFFGLDESRRPIYVPTSVWRKSHIGISGTTGKGKGVLAGVLATQATLQGETVVVIDPKNDEYLPHVLLKAARAAGVPYVYIDLQADTPQWNPIRNKTGACPNFCVNGVSVTAEGCAPRTGW